MTIIQEESTSLAYGVGHNRDFASRDTTLSQGSYQRQRLNIDQDRRRVQETNGTTFSNANEL